MAVLRVPVGLFHTFLAAGLATAGAIGLAQAQLNVKWEAGFYGSAHPMTLAHLLWGCLFLLAGASWGVGSLLHVIGSRFGAMMVLGTSAFGLVVMPLAIKAILVVCLVSAAFELLPTIPDGAVDDDDE